MSPSSEAIPIPPLEMRQLVGPTDLAAFENPTGELVFPWIPEARYGDVFDFGCGCGRVARKMMLQRRSPRRYVGIDLHRGMIAWCQKNLAARAPGYQFLHYDVFNRGLNPNGKTTPLPFPVSDRSFSLAIAWSVFTHVLESQVSFYLRECARILKPDGVLTSTWFLFDKRQFPMMQEFQNALYINLDDPTNAVIFDRSWVRAQAAAAGLVITFAEKPAIRGFHTVVSMMPRAAGVPEVELPLDDAPAGSAPPPVPTRPAHTIGLD